LRLREAAVDVRIFDVNFAEPEPFSLEIHPRCDGEPMSNHVTGHDKKQDEDDDDRTGLGGGGQ